MINAEFFDIFGFFGFVIITILGILILKRYHKVPDWIGGLLLLIGIAGALIDGTIVIKTFFLGG